MASIYTPRALDKGLRDLFLRSVSETASREPNIPALICEPENSGTNEEVYAWLGEAPQMEEFVDQLRAVGLTDATYTLSNKRWTSSVSVLRDMIMDDKLGLIRRRIRSMATVAARHPNSLILRAITDGATNTFVDGVAFFSASHPARTSRMPSTQSNTYTGTGTSVSQLSADFEGAIARAKRFVQENGEPYHEALNSFAIICPPELEQNLRTLLFGEIISQTSNVITRGRQVEVVSTGRLSDTNDWYLCILDGPTKPFVWQAREPLQFNALEEGSETAFRRKEYLYEASARYNAGYAAWQSCIRVTNS